MSANFGRREVREAIALLREAGLTAEQYATVELVEMWTVGDQQYEGRAEAFAAANAQANRTGEPAEVWLSYGPEADYAAESWIVKPD